jgi:tRNA pseudouridine38/39 synthase
MLNRILPPEIRAIAWSSVAQDFSARFSCLSRTYKYFFPRGDLNIEEMKQAAESLLGTHDFRNLCKPDIGNGVTNFVRSVARVSIDEYNRDLCVFTIEGKAFLWHQVRCIVAVLVLVGQGHESRDIIQLLLDIDKHPGKPQYSMAWEMPLCLFHCQFENVQWQFCEDSLKLAVRDLQKLWTQFSVK